MTSLLASGLALLTTGGLQDTRAAIVAAPATCALAVVAAAMIVGVQAALVVAGPRPSARRLIRAAAVAGLLPLAPYAPALALGCSVVVLATFPRRSAANDNFPVALGLDGRLSR